MAITIQEYIKKSLKSRRKWDDIRTSLIAAGHKPEAVNDVYGDMMDYRRTKRRVYGTAIAIVLIIAAVIVYPYIFDGNSFQSEPVHEELTDDDYIKLAFGNNDRSQCDKIRAEQLRSDCLQLVN